MQDDDNRASALLEKIMFQMARHSEMNEATLARMKNGLEQAHEIQRQQATMSETLDRLEAGQK